MADIAVQWIDDKKSKARFEIPQQGEWTAESITSLMQVLAQIRQSMTPEVPPDPPLLQMVEAIPDPRWWVQLDQFSGGTLLLLRHPSLGWLPFLLPIHERKRISELLAQQEAAFQNEGASH